MPDDKPGVYADGRGGSSYYDGGKGGHGHGHIKTKNMDMYTGTRTQRYGHMDTNAALGPRAQPMQSIQPSGKGGKDDGDDKVRKYGKLGQGGHGHGHIKKKRGHMDTDT